MNLDINIRKIKSIYFIGIGGVGMSSLALYFYANGCKVAGYDKSHSAITDMLESKGVQVNYHEDICNIDPNYDLVVYTPAINPTNVELAYAKELQMPIVKRAELLGMLCKGKFCIAVAGTHGKTSVTAMIANILSESNIAFEAFVGGICKTVDSNLYKSDGAQVVIVEADEYDRSFLNLKPDIAVVTSVSADHLEVYGSKEELQKSFVQFMSSCRPSLRIVNGNYKDIFDTNVTYGFNEDAKYRIVDYNYVNGLANVVINDGVRDVKFENLPLRGKFNIENFCAAFAVASVLKCDYDKIACATRKFKGVCRRFEIKFENERVTLIDDYAHHPEEINCLIEAIREIYPDKKVCGVFQPHLFSRTQMFMDEFATVLSKFDEMYLLDIYPAREMPIEGVTSNALFEKINVGKGNVVMKNIVPQIFKKSDADIFVTIGAGNVDRMIDEIIDMLKMK